MNSSICVHIRIASQMVMDVATRISSQETMSDAFVTAPQDWDLSEGIIFRMVDHCTKGQVIDNVVYEPLCIGTSSEYVGVGRMAYKIITLDKWHDGDKIITTTFEVEVE
jgi:hypothetical protein